MKFDIMLACDINGIIGKDNKLPWSFLSDMSFFRKKTLYTDLPNYFNVVIMGRNTYNSVKFLDGRINIVVSKTLYKKNMDKFCEKYQTFEEAKNDTIFVENFQHALTIAMFIDNVESIFVIGGVQLYSEAFSHPCCRYLYLTEIASEYEGDTLINRPGIYMDFNIIKSSEIIDTDRLQNKRVALNFKKMISNNYSSNSKSIIF